MAEQKLSKIEARHRRHLRIRQKVVGTAERPRLSIYRSLRHMYAQLIDDVSGGTLVGASTLSEKLAAETGTSGNVSAAEKVGEALARKALALGIRRVCFDRNGYKFHGRVKALAEAARKAGLVF